MTIIKQMVDEYLDINIQVTGVNWSSTATYDFGEEAFFGHYYYTSIIDGNTGLQPDINPNEWLLNRVSNRYAQIDLRATTYTRWDSTTATNPNDHFLFSKFANKSYDFIGFGGVSGEDIEVKLYDSNDNLIYTATGSVYARPNSNTWYNYYFDTFAVTDDRNSFVYNLPPIPGGYITTKVTVNADDYAQVGFMAVGNQKWMGDTLMAGNFGFEDNSQIEKDDFGITTIIKRTANKTADIDTIFPAARLPDMMRDVRDALGEVLVFVIDDKPDTKYENLTILGYLEDFSTILGNNVAISGSFSIREVI